MRRLLLCLLFFLIVSSTVALSINTAYAYEKENHYWLKIALALNCGFDIDQARLIAIGDFSIDDDPDTQPVTPGGGKDSVKWKWHALPQNNPDVDKNSISDGNQEIKQRQHELYDRAMNTGNLSVKLFNFGQYLHYTEDKWGHWGYTTFIGHGLEEIKPGTTSPDATHANPENYRYMVFDSMVNLGKLAKSIGIKSKCETDMLPLDTYHSTPEFGTDFPWISPQEIKRTQNPDVFKNKVSEQLRIWEKSQLIDENIQHSKSEGASGVTENIIYHISQETGISKEKIKKDKEFVSVDIDNNGRLITSLYSYIRVDLKPNIEQTSAIPNWIKSNVKWWSDGIVSDREFANSVGFLVKENVIKVNLPINSDGTIKISENLVIPSWIKSNAKWWSDGMTSDQEFTSAIEYMINQNIISFSDSTHILSLDDQEFFENLYATSMWNEAAIASLASINDAEVEILGDLAANAWDEYHLSDNPQDMDNAKSFELLLEQQDSLAPHIQNLQVLAKDTSGQVKTIAQMYGSKLIDLDSIAEPAQKKIDHPFKISDADNLNKGLDEFDMLDKKATVPGMNPFDFLAEQEIDNQDILNLINEFGIPPENLGSLDTPGITIEDRIMLLLMEMSTNMDKQISEQAEKIQSLNSGTTNPSTADPKTLDVESMKLKRLTDKRGQLFDICRQIIDRYNEIAKSAIHSLRDGGSVTEKETTKPESTEPITPPQDTQQGKQVVVLVISGKYYPLSQFFDVQAHTPNCDAMHYHSEFPKVRSIDGVLLSDPNPSTCGFGKVGLIPVDVVFMTQDQIDSFKSAMGIEP